MRALLDDPVVYFHDLSNEERTYLEKHRSYLLRQISEATGLIAEVRAEGIAMVAENANLTNLPLPQAGIEGRLSLAIARWLGDSCTKVEAASISLSAVKQHIRQTKAETSQAHNALLR